MKLFNYIIIGILLLLIPIIGIGQASQEKSNLAKEVLTIPWNRETKGSLKTAMNPHGSFGVKSFVFLNDKEIALLSNIEKKVKIYNYKNSNYLREFNLEKSFKDFTYDKKNKVYYFYEQFKIHIYSEEGEFIEKFDYDKRAIRFVRRIRTYNGNLFLLTSKGHSYQITNQTNPIEVSEQKTKSTKGWLLGNGEFAFTKKKTEKEYEIVIYGKKEYRKAIKFEHKIGAIEVVDATKDYYYLYIGYYKDNGLETANKIVIYSIKENSFVDIIDVPNITYTNIRYPVSCNNEKVFHLISTPENLTLLKLGADPSLMNLSFPKKYDYEYHYLKELKLPEMPREPMMNEINETDDTKSFGNTAGDEMMPHQMINIAKNYLWIEWNATSNNIAGTSDNENFDIGEGYLVQTPSWISPVGAKTGVPYKWGGWTHYNHFKNLAELGKYTGDISCASPFTYTNYANTTNLDVIGIDCSGLISRAWNLGSKRTTENETWGLINSNLSTQYANIDQVKRGDFLQKTSHVRLVVNYNADTESIDVIESVTTTERPHSVNYDRVAEETYSETNLTNWGYTGYYKNDKLDYDLIYLNLHAPDVIYHNGSMTVQFELENNSDLGANGEYFDGSIRVMVYNNYPDENSDEPGVLSFQIGSNYVFADEEDEIGPYDSRILKFTEDLIPEDVPDTYLIAIEYLNENGRWSRIPETNYSKMQTVELEYAEFDLGITKLEYPNSIGDYGEDEVISVQLYNFGNQVHNFQSIPVEITGTVSFNSSSVPFSETINYGLLGPSNVMSVDVVESFDFSTYGEYCINAKTNFLIDNETENDAMSETCIESRMGIYPSFTASNTIGEAPLNVRFTNTSTGDITSYHWDFGDGNYSNEASPCHEYTRLGIYNVSLTVTGLAGTDVYSKNDLVKVTNFFEAINVHFTSNNNFGDAPLTVNFKDRSSSPTGTIIAWEWDFGDNHKSNDQHPEHTYENSGYYDVKLTVTDNNYNSNSVILEDYIYILSGNGSAVLSPEIISVCREWIDYGPGGPWSRKDCTIESIKAVEHKLRFYVNDIDAQFHELEYWSIDGTHHFGNRPPEIKSNGDKYYEEAFRNWNNDYNQKVRYCATNYAGIRYCSPFVEFDVITYPDIVKTNFSFVNDQNVVPIGNAIYIQDETITQDGVDYDLRIKWKDPDYVRFYCNHGYGSCNFPLEEDDIYFWVYYSSGVKPIEFSTSIGGGIWSNSGKNRDEKKCAIVDCETYEISLDDHTNDLRWFDENNISNHAAGRFKLVHDISDTYKVKYHACDEITFSPGFTANEGCELTARIIDPYSPADGTINQNEEYLGLDDMHYQIDIANIKVYPNPNDGEFLISLDSKLEFPINYRLTNMLGNTILMQGNINNNQTSLDISHLPDGMYFLNILTNNYIWTKKIIKK